MAHSPQNEGDSSSLPEAVEVTRDTLRKLEVQILELPVAHFAESEDSEDNLAEEELSEEDDEEEESQDAIGELDYADHDLSNDSGKSLAEQQKLINRRALDSTNRNKDPSSRSFVRGVLHTSPRKVIWAAIFALLARLSLLVFIVLVTLVLLEKIDLKLAWFALVFPIAGLLHLLTMNQARCRVCGLKEFAPSRALKHKHSHRFLFFGPLISTAVHVLVFRWFRCLFCGTPIRIKK